MLVHHYLQDVLVFLATVVVFAPIFHRLKISPVLAFLVSGVIVGPHMLGLIDDVEGARRLGEFGVVFLLFAIGLELSVDRLYILRRFAFGLGAVQVVLSASIIGGAAYAVVGDWRLAFIVGCTLALSSTAVVLRLLAERREMSTGFGRASLAVLLFQDLVVVPLLVIVPLLSTPGGAMASGIGIALAKAAAALVIIVVVGRFLIRPIIRLIVGTRLKEAFVGLTLLVALGTAWATEAAGLSLALGAFLAGVVVAETEYRHQVEADIQPFHGLLLGLFFMAVGMTIDLGFALQNIGIVMGLAAALLIAKAAIAAGAARVFGLSARESIRVGFMLSQAGEFGFILIALAAQTGGIGGKAAQLLPAVIALSMAATPFMALAGHRLARMVEHKADDAVSVLTGDVESLKDHVIIAGFGRVGQTIAKMLETRQIPVIALDLDTARIKEGRDTGFQVYYGEAGLAHIMHAAGADRAKAVVVTLDHPQRALRAVTMLSREFPKVPVIVRSRDHVHCEALRSAGATITVPEILEGSLTLGRNVLHTVGVSDADADAIVAEFRRRDYASMSEVIPAGRPPREKFENGKSETPPPNT